MESPNVSLSLYKLKRKTMAELTVTTFTNDTVTCRSFTNVGPDEEGIDLTMNGEHIGSIYGESIPDEEDYDEVDNFTAMIEDWLIDNNL